MSYILKKKRAKMSSENHYINPNEWQKQRLDRIAFVVPKGERDIIRNHAKSRGYKSVNAYLYNLVKKDMMK